MYLLAASNNKSSHPTSRSSRGGRWARGLLWMLQGTLRSHPTHLFLIYLCCCPDVGIILIDFLGLYLTNSLLVFEFTNLPYLEPYWVFSFSNLHLLIAYMNKLLMPCAGTIFSVSWACHHIKTFALCLRSRQLRHHRRSLSLRLPGGTSSGLLTPSSFNPNSLSTQITLWFRNCQVCGDVCQTFLMLFLSHIAYLTPWNKMWKTWGNFHYTYFPFKVVRLRNKCLLDERNTKQSISPSCCHFFPDLSFLVVLSFELSRSTSDEPIIKTVRAF